MGLPKYPYVYKELPVPAYKEEPEETNIWVVAFDPFNLQQSLTVRDWFASIAGKPGDGYSITRVNQGEVKIHSEALAIMSILKWGTYKKETV